MLEIILLIILVFLAAITAASETAIIASSRLKLKRMASNGSKPARLILNILQVPERFFGTILVANNIVDALIASIVTAIMIMLIKDKAKGIAIATAIVTVVIIVSEVAAKTLAAKRSERIAIMLVRPVQFLIFILSPVVKILSVITNFIVNLISPGKDAKVSLVTEEEIKALIKIGEEEGVLHKEEYDMLSNVLDFGDTVAKDVMIPADKMVSVEVDASLEATLDKVAESGYSRFPVYRERPDNIIGIINMKDLLNLFVSKGLFVLQDIIYPPTFIDENRKVSDLLKEFQKGHTHLAVVIDASKKVKGMVTLEDLLEEIVGEIRDEADLRNHKK